MAAARPIGKGTVAIVTGASSGIGFATAREFARRGATVLAVARREERWSTPAARTRPAPATSRVTSASVTSPSA
jgi:NAD(P)-dependent dehydrogenase (short-subunit alcohol dehydrogenase family)